MATSEHREPSGPSTNLQATALDEALGLGQFVIAGMHNGEFLEWICRDRAEMLHVLASEWQGRSDYHVRWKRDAGPAEIASAPLSPGWGTAY